MPEAAWASSDSDSEFDCDALDCIWGMPQAAWESSDSEFDCDALDCVWGMTGQKRAPCGRERPGPRQLILHCCLSPPVSRPLPASSSPITHPPLACTSSAATHTFPTYSPLYARSLPVPRPLANSRAFLAHSTPPSNIPSSSARQRLSSQAPCLLLARRASAASRPIPACSSVLLPSRHSTFNYC